MIKHISILFTILCFSITSVWSQQHHNYVVIGDSLYENSSDSIVNINLNEIKIISPYEFKNKRQHNKYQQLEQDLVRVYPIAQIVKREYSTVNKEFEQSLYDNKKRRKDYMKWYEKHIKESYMDTLSSLNLRQARLLLKMIDKETGKTPYELLKEYRGTTRAWMWRSAALLVGANLNSSYDEEDDKMIAHILKRIEMGQLEIPKPQ